MMCVNVWQLWITLQPSTTPLSCGFMVTQDHSSAGPQHSSDTASLIKFTQCSVLSSKVPCPFPPLAFFFLFYINSAVVKYNSSLNTDIPQCITKTSIYRWESADVTDWLIPNQDRRSLLSLFRHIHLGEGV